MYPADMLRVVVTALLAFSIIALLLASALHVATFFSTHLGGIPRYFGFHFGVIALWILAVMIYRAKGETIRPNALPQWSRAPLYFLFGYFVFNMIFLFVVLHGGGAEVVNGSYQLLEHGKLIGYLTENEYYRDITIELRFFSSGWMIAYAATAAYLLHLREVVTPGFREVHLG
jgi:hypothetical protein